MQYSPSNNKLIGIVGIIFGLICLASLLVIDQRNIIIPNSDLFLIKYFIVIVIVNSGLYFIVVGILGFMGIFVPSHAKTKIEYDRTKAKGILLSTIILTPFWLSLFATIFIMSKTMLWKTLGSLALVYIAWLLFSNIKVLVKTKDEK